jgi:hypothetical protein
LNKFSCFVDISPYESPLLVQFRRFSIVLGQDRSPIGDTIASLVVQPIVNIDEVHHAAHLRFPQSTFWALAQVGSAPCGGFRSKIPVETLFNDFFSHHQGMNRSGSGFAQRF